jgi:hypothetical protein
MKIPFDQDPAKRPPFPIPAPMPPKPRIVPKEQFKRVAETLAVELKRAAEAGKDAEGFLLTLHTVKNGRLYHRIVTQDFPNGDWGTAIIRVAAEAHRSISEGNTAVARVS